MKKQLFAVAGALIVVGAAAAGALYWAFPVRVSIWAGLTRNYLMSWSAPRGTASIESNPAFRSASVLALSPVSAASPSSSVTAAMACARSGTGGSLLALPWWRLPRAPRSAP
jgi:hypothetical protein